MNSTSTVVGLFSAPTELSNTIIPLFLEFQNAKIELPRLVAEYEQIEELREDIQKNENYYEIIINFSKYLVEKSKNIDSEFVDIVNDHFWDLI